MNFSQIEPFKVLLVLYAVAAPAFDAIEFQEPENKRPRKSSLFSAFREKHEPTHSQIEKNSLKCFLRLLSFSAWLQLC